MKRARQRIKALTGRDRVGSHLEDVIADLNLFLWGWGHYSRTGNAHQRFTPMDKYVAWRLHRLLVKQRGPHLRADQADRWRATWFHDQGLHRIVGTIRYPRAASPCPEDRR